MFVHLRSHSYYSLLEGLASPEALAQAAAAQGMPALALTDHNLLTGAVEFYDACRSAGVKPVLGLQLDIALPVGFPAVPAGSGSASLVLLAADSSGWASLCRLSSIYQADMGGSQPVPFERLAEHTAGLICLTGGLFGWAEKLISLQQEAAARAYLGLLGELFPGRAYVELQAAAYAPGREIDNIPALAKACGLPLVATHPVEFLKKDDSARQSLASAMRLNLPTSDLPESASAPPDAYFASEQELSLAFQKMLYHVPFRTLARATLEIAERCHLELPLGKPQFPQISIPAGLSADQWLRQKAEEGARRLYGDAALVQGIDLQARLDHELSVIAKCGYASLFLVMEEIIQYARKIGVPISSRGSAASSLVAHCLGITSPDPLRLNLYFERFLNPARATPPDIDTDLCSRRRDEVIRFVYERFGADRVAMVCTINCFRPRSALREVAKAYGLPADEIKLLADSLPHRWWSPGAADKDASPFAELEAIYQTRLHKQVFRDARQFIGVPRHLSIHPGGVVIAPNLMTDLVPVLLAAKGVVITQFDLESIERLGLVKIDLLGIRGLTVQGDLAQALYAASPGRYASPLDALEAIPTEDEDTSRLVMNGQTIGCFQIESPGMRATLREIQAKSVDDLMIALALYRPGPLTGGLKDAFVRRHRGLEPIAHLHPALALLLEDTYGVILYQEQVLRIANSLAGFNLAEADLLRRAMSHLDPGKQMQALKEKFIQGAQEKSGVPADTAERIWELMAAFSGYGFPKAHAASYAMVAWRSAWCKAHYPAAFIAAVLANWGGYYGQRVYLTEARRRGLQVRPPHVDYAHREFSAQTIDGTQVLFMGLDQVRDLTRRTQENILRLRPFQSLADFLARVDPRPLEVEYLIKVGALDGLGTIPALLAELKGGVWRGGQLSLFSLMDLSAGASETDWSLAEKVAAQEEILGAGLAAHPLELVADQIKASGAVNTLEAAARQGQRVRVVGIRQTWRRSFTARGEPVYFFSLEDLEGMLDVVVFANVYRRHRKDISGEGPLGIEGIVELDQSNGEPFIRAERAWCLDDPSRR
jgi:DNA polymerase III subunit alpha